MHALLSARAIHPQSFSDFGAHCDPPTSGTGFTGSGVFSRRPSCQVGVNHYFVLESTF